MFIPYHPNIVPFDALVVDAIDAKIGSSASPFPIYPAARSTRTLIDLSSSST